jgi:hypothetical protein
MERVSAVCSTKTNVLLLTTYLHLSFFYFSLFCSSVSSVDSLDSVDMNISQKEMDDLKTFSSMVPKEVPTRGNDIN